MSFSSPAALDVDSPDSFNFDSDGVDVDESDDSADGSKEEETPNGMEVVEKRPFSLTKNQQKKLKKKRKRKRRLRSKSDSFLNC